MGRVQKQPIPAVAGSVHKQRQIPDDLLRFSFRYFSFSAKFCPPEDAAALRYINVFMERLRSVSDLRVSEFRSSAGKALRAHRHDWACTSEAEGYAHLNEQLRQCEPWQFCLTANEHGRVHGILIDSVFYVVWLDPHHRLYPGA